MFNNLIESTSHVKEFKRRGSFVLLTTISYGVLLAIAGVASVYAYDAHLDSQNTELEITFVPFLEAAQPEPPKSIVRPAAGAEGHNATESTRTKLIDSTSNPNNPPEKIGTIAPDVPPALPTSKLGRFNADPETPSFSVRNGVTGGTGNTPAVDVGAPPPPVPTPKPEPPKVLKISRILNSQAVSLPKPIYPPMAKQIKVQGTVSVQVLIDETGKVIQAKATGHPLLIAAAQSAAMQARFSPTIIGETPVKISGVITYNFVMP